MSATCELKGLLRRCWMLTFVFAALAVHGAVAAAPSESADAIALGTVDLAASSSSPATTNSPAVLWTEKLEIARRFRLARLFNEAVPAFVMLVTTNTPETIKKAALYELAICAQEQNELAKAQQIFAQFLTKWPTDSIGPEIMLRQGLIYRQMGLNNMAMTKFYAVMTSSLTLKSDSLEYYQRLVLQAQMEIAETYYQQGKYKDSLEYFKRLLKTQSNLLNRPLIHFKLIRSLSAMGEYDQVASAGYEFLNGYSTAPELAEVRFYLAMALKRLGQSDDSLQQVLALLRDEHGRAQADGSGENWVYWQQRTGNEIANQFYKEGDFLRALEIYSALEALNPSAEWQLPVWYQIGLTYEHLQQPTRAAQQYARIASRRMEGGTNLAPSLSMIVDMAKWREQHLKWQTNVTAVAREFTGSPEQNSVR